MKEFEKKTEKRKIKDSYMKEDVRKILMKNEKGMESVEIEPFFLLHGSSR